MGMEITGQERTFASRNFKVDYGLSSLVRTFAALKPLHLIGLV